jgi:16S rRNA (cytosine967-C5)-methyltransferase
MPVTPARASAYDILLSVNKRDAYASELLHSDRLRDLSASDRALTTEIVIGVLRWQSLLDANIAEHSSQKLSKLDVEVLVALRIAAYQIAFTRVPSRAAVNESVELVKRARKRSAMPFANAVLRKLAAAPPPSFGDAAVPPEHLADRYAHPQWLVSRWIAEHGEDAARQICRFDQQVPATSLRLSDPSVELDLRAEGVELAPGTLMTSARRVVGGDVTHTRAFAAGRVAIQDEGSQLVAALVGRGFRLLDCCAAPGGKTAVLAERNPEAKIVAVELHPHRARLLRERVTAPNVEVLTADATALPVGSDFDRILADVPCSGTGTLAHNPEIKWKLTAEDISDLHSRQVAILRGALSHLAIGGKLVYSTCSLEREENEEVVAEVLRDRSDYRLMDVREELQQLQRSAELIWPEISSLVRGKFLRTIPGIQPCDGFFAAIISRIE